MYGKFLEDLKTGQMLKHWPGRTITETDDTWFSLLTQNGNPLHIDHNYSKHYGPDGAPITNGTLVFAVAVGQTVSDISGRAIANLEYAEIKHHAPVFHGDTIYTYSKVKSITESSSGDRGVAEIETTVINQNKKIVMTFRRKVLIPKRNHPTMGENKLPMD